MLELNSETFHQQAKQSSFFVCVFHRKSVDKPTEILSSILGSEKNTMSATTTCVDTEKFPEIAQLFGATADEPAILIMREQIVLYCEPLSSIDKNAAHSIFRQVSALNMDDIREEIEISKQSHAHLFGRNVCPTAKRTR